MNLKKYFRKFFPQRNKEQGMSGGKLGQKVSRRQALKNLSATAIAGGALAQGCKGGMNDEEFENLSLAWDEYFKTNYRLMSIEEKQATISRLERIHQKNHEGEQVSNISISQQEAIPESFTDMPLTFPNAKAIWIVWQPVLRKTIRIGHPICSI